MKDKIQVYETDMVGATKFILKMEKMDKEIEKLQKENEELKDYINKLATKKDTDFLKSLDHAFSKKKNT